MQSERDVQRSDPVEIDAALALLIPRKVFDETALTVEEVAERSGVKTQKAQRCLDEAVQAGTWEQVHKHTPHGRVARAYRPKK